jgi:hypothetical protein
MNTSSTGRNVAVALSLSLAAATVALLLAAGAAAAQVDPSAIRDGWSASAGTRPAGTSALGAVSAPAAAAAGQEPYVPFVTDFGKEPRVPGRTVVIGPLRPVAEPGPVAEPVGGRSWADVALGATMGVGFATLLALGLVGARRLRGRGESGLADASAGAAH